MIDIIKKSVKDSIEAKQNILQAPLLLEKIEKAAQTIIQSYKAGNKTLFCGNGGSAADAQHLAAELSGRFYYDRPPLYSEALHVNTSYLTAVANDYAFEDIYARYIKAAGQHGDVLVGLSTSGNSANVIKAFETANNIGMKTIALTGKSGGKMQNTAHILINVPSDDTPRIQESHILIGHIICQLVESTIFPKK